MPEWETDATAPTMRVLYQGGVALSPHSIVANLEEYAGEAPSVVDVQETLDTDCCNDLPVIAAPLLAITGKRLQQSV